MATGSRHSIIVARTMQDAINSATVEWRWYQIGSPDFRLEFQRPDTNERIRWAPEHDGLRGHGWGTMIYLAHECQRRHDWQEIQGMIEQRYLIPGDPLLAAPRQKRKSTMELLAEELLRSQDPGRRYYGGGR